MNRTTGTAFSVVGITIITRFETLTEQGLASLERIIGSALHLSTIPITCQRANSRVWREPNILTNKPSRVKGNQFTHKPMARLNLTQRQIGRAKIESSANPARGELSFSLKLGAGIGSPLGAYSPPPPQISDTRDGASRIRPAPGAGPDPADRQKAVADRCRSRPRSPTPQRPATR